MNAKFALLRRAACGVDVVVCNWASPDEGRAAAAGCVEDQFIQRSLQLSRSGSYYVGGTVRNSSAPSVYLVEVFALNAEEVSAQRLQQATRIWVIDRLPCTKHCG